MTYTISLFSTTYPRYPGDYLPAFVFGFARAMVQAGHTVHVFAPFPPDYPSSRDELHAGVHVHRFHYWWPQHLQRLCYGNGILSNYRRNRLLALQVPFLILGFVFRALPYAKYSDVVQGHWTFSGLAASIIATLFHKPLVMRFYSAEFSSSLMRPLNRYLIAQADGIMVNSHFTAAKVREFDSKLNPLVHPEGIEPEKIAPDDFDGEAFLRRQHIRPDLPVVLAAGRLVERKGYHVLVESIPYLLAQQPVTVILAGRGPQRDRLQRLIDESALNQHIRLVGFVEDDDLAGWYRVADVFALPAIEVEGDTEGLGMVIAEAMINRTAVVGSATGGIIDIIQHGETGMLAKPGDALDLATQINQLLADDELRQRVTQRGFEHAASHFDWSAIVDHIQGHYDAILNATA